MRGGGGSTAAVVSWRDEGFGKETPTAWKTKSTNVKYTLRVSSSSSSFVGRLSERGSETERGAKQGENETRRYFDVAAEDNGDGGMFRRRSVPAVVHDIEDQGGWRFNCFKKPLENQLEFEMKLKQFCKPICSTVIL